MATNPSVAPADLRIFISYRRDDTPGFSGRLYDSLTDRFGEDRVFMDIDTIHPGRDFTQELADALDRCTVMLALIGPTWLTRTGESGRPRLEDPDDFVVMELTAALRRKIVVVPVLVHNATMPTRQQLPEALAELANRQAFELSNRWKADVRTLTDGLERLVAEQEARARAAREARARWDSDTEELTVVPAAGRVPTTSRGGRLRANVRAHPWRWAAGTLTTSIVLPFLALIIGWMVFDIPAADDATAYQATTFAFADGSRLADVRPTDANGANVDRRVVPLDRIPEHVRQAVIAAEDPTFYTNAGVTVPGLFGAADPTITQKYVRLSAGQTGASSLWNEYRIAVLSMRVSREQTKDQILENYLNTIYFGRSAWGVQAAAKAYFAKDVDQLTLSEGAMLAGLIPAPFELEPAKNREGSTRQWNSTLDRMLAANIIDAGQRAQQTFPLVVPQLQQPNGLPDDDRYHIYQLAVAELEAIGISQSQIDTESLTVTTTIDPAKQADAVNAAGEVLRGQPRNLRSSVVSIDARSGAILAYFGASSGAEPDRARALRRPGSAFEPFVLAAALQSNRGVGLGTRYDGSSPQEFDGGITVRNPDGVNCAPCSAKTAMAKSANTVFYRMALDTGIARVIEVAHRAGIPADLLPELRAGTALGDQEVRPVDMASAYATFAANGVRHAPRVVAKVVSSDGRILFENSFSSSGDQTVPEQVSRNVTESMLGLAGSADLALADGRPSASKPGTAPSDTAVQNSDAWYVGYTPQISTAVWVGTDANGPIKDSAGRPVDGRTIPGSIWQQYMSRALAGEAVEQFPPFVAIGTP